jgi:hypothetical protein
MAVKSKLGSAVITRVRDLLAACESCHEVVVQSCMDLVAFKGSSTHAISNVNKIFQEVSSTHE